ncbi:MAG: NADP-dependent isocitrate dehydrogenase [Treponemataceae bacterium]|nr:MAG: NADP-dependent isocitrate dehydrogenase [Treponemataceae bacterium]
MTKITMANAIAELDGDEMTRVLWSVIKEKLLLPFIELKTEYYDLSLTHRDATEDAVTHEAAAAIARLKVGVKCATITSNEARKTEYKLAHLTPSPNAIIRASLDGTVFRKPIVLKNVLPTVSAWKKPLTIARHAYGDIYKNCEMRVPGAGKAELVFTDAATGEITRKTIAEFSGAGILQGIHNTDASIASFAKSCFLYALSEKIDLWFSAKDTISKTYDGHFKKIFETVAADFAADFKRENLTFFYTLIDDAVARIMHHEGGILWALKNYDGDVMSDMTASASGSLAMMTSMLVSPNGVFEYEAAHGTVQKHYYRYLAGEKTSTNPVALIFAWSGALNKRGELDGTPAVCAFAHSLESAVIAVIENGTMTQDLAALVAPDSATLTRRVDSWQFIDAVAARLEQTLAQTMENQQ